MANHEFQDLPKMPDELSEKLEGQAAFDSSNSLEVLKGSSVESIISDKDIIDEKKDILDIDPDAAFSADKDDLARIEEEIYSEKLKKMKPVSFVFSVVFVLSLSFNVFQKSKLNASLNLVGLDQETQVNQLRSDLDAEIAVQSLMNQSLNSQVLAYNASEYYSLYKKFNSPLTDSGEKKKIFLELMDLQKDLSLIFKQIDSSLKLAKTMAVEDSVKLSLGENIKDKASKYKGQSVNLFSPFYTYETVLNTMNDQNLSKLINEFPGEDAQPDKFISFLRAYFKLHSDSYLDQLASLDLNSISILHLFNELESKAKVVDPEFSIFSNSDASLKFQNYNFNPENRSLSIQTQVKSKDPKTFTLLASLYESLSSSSLFEEINPSNLSKVKEDEGFYTSSVNINLNLNERL